MRISDWSSDVCSSDLRNHPRSVHARQRRGGCRQGRYLHGLSRPRRQQRQSGMAEAGQTERALHQRAAASLQVRREQESAAAAAGCGAGGRKIGRSTGRERGGQTVEIWVGRLILKKKQTNEN